MNLFAIFAFAVVVLSAIFTTSEAYHHHKKLKIKHVWKAGHGKHGYGHGYGHGKKLTGFSKRYQHMKHGM